MNCMVIAGDNSKSLTPQLIVLNDQPEEEAAPAEAASPGAQRKKEKPIPKWGDNPTVQVGPHTACLHCHTHHHCSGAVMTFGLLLCNAHAVVVISLCKWLWLAGVHWWQAILRSRLSRTGTKPLPTLGTATLRAVPLGIVVRGVPSGAEG